MLWFQTVNFTRGLFQGVDSGELVKEVKSLKELVRKQERRIKVLEEQVAELERQRQQAQQEEEELLADSQEEEGEERGQLV